MDENLQMLSILKDFYSITGARVSIYDTELNEIAAFPQNLSPFCRLVQKKSNVMQMCHTADSNAFEQVRLTGKRYTYKCHCGLIETVAPIYHYGVLSGFFMMGQISDDKTDSMREIARLSEGFFECREDLWRAVEQIPVIKEIQLQSYINILSIISEYLSQTHRIAPKFQELPSGILHYIHQNYQNDLSVKRLCLFFDCSRTTLMNTFKKKYGITLGAYIKDYRITQACELLLKSNKSIKEIAVLCGFSEQNYFSKVFSEKYNCSPSEYRKSR